MIINNISCVIVEEVEREVEEIVIEMKLPNSNVEVEELHEIETATQESNDETSHANVDETLPLQIAVKEEKPTAVADLTIQFDAKNSGTVLSYNHRGEPIMLNPPPSSPSKRRAVSREDIDQTYPVKAENKDSTPLTLIISEQTTPESTDEFQLSEDLLSSPTANLNLSPHLRSLAEKKLVFQSPMKDASGRTPTSSKSPATKNSDVKCLGVTLSCNHRGEAIIEQGPLSPSPIKKDTLAKKSSEWYAISR